MAFKGSRFVFVVPLKARASSRNWSAVRERLRTTLDSLLNQSEPAFRVIVACQDRPDLPAMDDPRFEWCPVEGEPPAPGDAKAGGKDKRHKVMEAGVFLREHGADDFYRMLLDADDLVHRDLVRTVLAADNRRGHTMRTGYFYDFANKALGLFDAPNSRFYVVCGSSCVTYLTAADLPASVDDTGTKYSGTYDFVRHSGRGIPRALRQELRKQDAARPMAPLPIHGAVYRVNHDDSQQRMKRGVRAYAGDYIAPREAAVILARDFGWKDAPLARAPMARVADGAVPRQRAFDWQRRGGGRPLSPGS